MDSSWVVENWPASVTFTNITAAQRWEDFLLWEDFLNDHRGIKMLIELGTYRGGFSLFLLSQCLNRGMIFYTVDRSFPEAAESPLGKMLQLRDHCIIDDLLQVYGSQWLKKIITAVENHPLLLYCDNGNKPVEFNTYTPLLASGDIVAVHDWNIEIKEEDMEYRGMVETLYEERCNKERSLTRFFRRL